jgi:DNA mismatch endonuclease, patch repair protein
MLPAILRPSPPQLSMSLSSGRPCDLPSARLHSFRNLEKRLAGGSQPKTTAKISRRMGRVRQRGTTPELLIRRHLTKLGFKYRTKNKNLPGSPDLANRSKKWAAFVHGCFWHQHVGCSKATLPKSNIHFWSAKFAANRHRDERAKVSLEQLGFRVITLWECQAQDTRRVRDEMAQCNSGMKSTQLKTSSKRNGRLT